PGATRIGESMARRRRPIFRRQRRVPHGVPLPADAAHLHVRAPRAALPHLGDLVADAGDPRWLPVGHLLAQPRRADPRDGDRRRARLHVHRVRARPADEGEYRHPTATRSAAGKLQRPDGALYRSAALAAGLAGALLRRRDRDGRQHLARRPRRRAHPDAVDTRPQRRLLQLRSRPAVPAGDHGPDLWLPGPERRGTDAHLDVVAALDPTDDRHPQAAPDLWCGHFLRAWSVESEHPGVRPRVRRRPGPVCQQPVALSAAGRTRPTPIRGRGSGGDAGGYALPEGWRAALPADPAGPWLLLVHAAGQARGGCLNEYK